MTSPRERTWLDAGIGEGAWNALRNELLPSELWSLLLGVLEARAASRAPADLLEQYERDGYTEPAPVDQRTFLRIDAELFAAAERFEAVELSPVAPLGVCSALAPASQNKVLSALRGTEVVSDPTNVLALECARRLRRDTAATVRLATTHRVLRAQQLPKRSGFTRHFRLFCLASGAREQRDHAFVVTELVEHVHTLLDGMARLERAGFAFPDKRVRVLASAEKSALGDRIAAAIRGVPVTRETLAHPYYDGLRFMLFTRSPAGDDIPIGDGGAFDWLKKLTSNRKLVFVASAIGEQIMPLVFRDSRSTGA
ncbi:MAG TPA: hypothetical protein VGK73_25505 [Polyangiaceae bacterium]